MLSYMLFIISHQQIKKTWPKFSMIAYFIPHDETWVQQPFLQAQYPLDFLKKAMWTLVFVAGMGNVWSKYTILTTHLYTCVITIHITFFNIYFNDKHCI